jgi:hypothetical protein
MTYLGREGGRGGAGKGREKWWGVGGGIGAKIRLGTEKEKKKGNC